MERKNGLFGLLLVMLTGSAAVCTAKGQPSQGAHIHGEAVLNLVLDDNALYIELESPAINLIGFEHQPINDEQASILLKAKQMLTSADRLFHFATAHCSLENVVIEVPYMKNEHQDRHSRQEEQHEHADFHASYTFQCEQTKDLTAISIKLFSLFPAIQNIKVQWIFQDKQGSAVLTARDHTLPVN